MNTITKVAIATGLTAVFLLARRQMKLLYGYEWKLKNVKAGNISMANLELFFTIEVKNKSSIGFEVTGYDLDLFLDDGKKSVLAAKVSNKEATPKLVKPKGTAQLEIKFSTSPAKVFKADNLATLLTAFTPGKLLIKLKGIVSAKSGPLNITAIPVDYSTTLANILKPEEKAKEKV